jgi:hypothetical protein
MSLQLLPIQYRAIALIFKIFLLIPNLSMYRITCISLFGSLASLYRDILSVLDFTHD